MTGTEARRAVLHSPYFHIAVIALLWEAASRTILAPWRVLPAPSAILVTLWQSRDTLYPHLAVTAQEAFYGYLWGNGAAILLAVVAFLLPVIEPALGRVTLIIHCLPLLVLGPLLQILFSNMTPIIILSGLFVLFTTFIAALLGLRQVDQQSLVVLRAFGGSKKDELLRVRFIAWLPSLLAGLSQAAPAAVVGAMVGEYMGSTTGLGVAMIYAQNSFQVERTWAICALSTALAFVGYGLMQGLGWWLTPWARDHGAIALGTLTEPPLRGNKWRRAAKWAASFLAGGAAAIGLWYGFLWACSLDPYFAKTPVDLWNYLATDPEAAAHRSQFFLPTLVTLGHAGGGLLLGFGVALLAVVGIRFWSTLEKALTPYMLLIVSIPIAAMIPVISLVCGRGTLAVMVAVALLTFLPSFITLLVGFKSAPAQASSIVRVAGGSLWRAVWTVQFPFAMPWVFAALKSAAPAAMGGSLLGEWLITGDGLAAVMQQSRTVGDYTAIWTSSIWIVLLSLGFFTVVSVIETPFLARMSLRAV
jgi:ABC-type nitrate/sulfonate/bicarbonate transport system permease component